MLPVEGRLPETGSKPLLSKAAPRESGSRRERMEATRNKVYVAAPPTPATYLVGERQKVAPTESPERRETVYTPPQALGPLLKPRGKLTERGPSSGPVSLSIPRLIEYEGLTIVDYGNSHGSPRSKGDNRLWPHPSLSYTKHAEQGTEHD